MPYYNHGKKNTGPLREVRVTKFKLYINCKIPM